MLSWLPKGLSIWRAAKRLQGTVSSQTTRSQWKGSGVLVLVAGLAIAGAGHLWPESPFGNVGVQEGVLAVLLWALSPLASRVAGKLDTNLDGPVVAGLPSSPPPAAAGPSVLDRSSLWVEHVKTYQQGSWTDWKGTAMDAVYEGWDLGATAGGEIWDLQELRKVGVIGEPVVDAGLRGRAMKKLREDLDAIERGEVG